MSNLFSKVYEDSDGIRYKLVSIEDNQFVLEVVDSPFSHIIEGVRERKSQLPPHTVEDYSSKLKNHV
jgi:hypothetical protein